MVQLVLPAEWYDLKQAGTKNLSGETLEQVLHQQRMAGRKADDQCFNFLQHASASAHVSRVWEIFCRQETAPVTIYVPPICLVCAAFFGIVRHCLACLSLQVQAPERPPFHAPSLAWQDPLELRQQFQFNLLRLHLDLPESCFSHDAGWTSRGCLPEYGCMEGVRWSIWLRLCHILVPMDVFPQNCMIVCPVCPLAKPNKTDLG